MQNFGFQNIHETHVLGMFYKLSLCANLAVFQFIWSEIY